MELLAFMGFFPLPHRAPVAVQLDHVARRQGRIIARGVVDHIPARVGRLFCVFDIAGLVVEGFLVFLNFLRKPVRIAIPVVILAAAGAAPVLQFDTGVCPAVPADLGIAIDPPSNRRGSLR